MSDKYCYSRNKEDYYGEYDSIEAALADARDYPEEPIWVGRIVPASQVLALYAKHLAESVVESANGCLDNEIDAGEDIMSVDDLDGLGSVIMAWLEKNAAFGQFAIVDVQKYE